MLNRCDERIAAIIQSPANSKAGSDGMIARGVSRKMPTRREAPSVRILPMSDKAEGFPGRTIEQVQKRCFLRELPARQGRYRYPSAGLNAVPGSLVLFQFKARVIASAVLRRDEKFKKGGLRGSGRARP